MAAHLKVGVVEAVDDVPAQLQELLPLQQDAVEEAEGEEQLAVEDRPGAARELGLRHQLVQALHVGLHSLRTDTQLHRATHCGCVCEGVCVSVVCVCVCV